MEEHFNKADKIIEDIQKVTDRIKEVMAQVEKNKKVQQSTLTFLDKRGIFQCRENNTTEQDKLTNFLKRVTWAGEVLY